MGPRPTRGQARRHAGRPGAGRRRAPWLPAVLGRELPRPAYLPAGEGGAVRRLTPREREVLGLIAEGSSNGAIARWLVVTEGAVEKHTQRIFAKLGLTQEEDQHRRVMATLAYLRS